jgi:hypothetical protein
MQVSDAHRKGPPASLRRAGWRRSPGPGIQRRPGESATRPLGDFVGACGAEEVGREQFVGGRRPPAGRRR